MEAGSLSLHVCGAITLRNKNTLRHPDATMRDGGCREKTRLAQGSMSSFMSGGPKD